LSRLVEIWNLVMPSKIGRIPDRHEALWHMTSFFVAHPSYRALPLVRMRGVQQAIALGHYCCLTDGKTIEAVATWHPIDLAALRQFYPHYVFDSTQPIDGIFLTSLAAINRASLNIMIRHLRTKFSDKDVYWDRHKGEKLGHKPAKRQLKSDGPTSKGPIRISTPVVF
jgi:hypothetical protein